MKESQKNGLKRILIHAYETTDYYKDLFAKCRLDPFNFKDVSELEKLPLLDKNIIKENVSRMISSRVPKVDLLKDSTGGSTGVPLEFYRDRECIRKRKGQELFFDRWMGYEIGDKIGLFVAARHSVKGARGVKGRFKNATFERILAFDPSRTDEKYMEWFYYKLKEFNPGIIKCFPNSLTIFAKYLKKKEYCGISPKAVSCTGENLYDEQKKLFEDVFQCPVYEKFGCFESGVIFCECSEHNGLHTFTEGAYVEYLTEGRKSKPGEIADIIITDLFNYGMPFIRYKIGDKAIYTDRKCKCGSNLPLVQKILGRDRDILYTISGQPIPGYLFVEIFNKNKIPGQFQVLQHNINLVEVKIVRSDLFNKNHENLILSKFKDILGLEYRIHLNYVVGIPRENSGKYAYVKNLMS